jgi:uncharacterized protein YdaU (DUF1376 family)
MNFYPHHIGDFRSATMHLSKVERWFYRDTLELYYDIEAPLPIDDDWIFRKVGAKNRQEREAVTSVLREFYVRTTDGYRNPRCDAEIAKYQAKRKQARDAVAARKDRK